ncbi:MAG: acyltransferase family protein [Pirellulales bacterium]|nr:acyltransferase family protein [Pirellulales bacterium]
MAQENLPGLVDMGNLGTKVANAEIINRSARQHYLDALRASAMFLGIILHAALSFSGGPWIVQDLQTHEFYGWLFSAIHGFRMPLFIMLSGYFTMLLWQKRGMTELLRQRFVRVLIPCLLGVVTILPIMDWATITSRDMVARQNARRSAKDYPRLPLIEAVKAGDHQQLRQLLGGGADPNAADAEFGIPSLSWAVMQGDPIAVRELIQHGADVNAADRGGYRALHSAAFLGYPEVAEILIHAGADPLARGGRADRPADSAKADWETTKFIAGMLRIPLREQAHVRAGRDLSVTLLARHTPLQNQLAAAQRIGPFDVDQWRERYNRFLMTETLLTRWGWDGEAWHLILTPVFDHLWFLWFLCWLVPVFVIGRLLKRAAGVPGLPPSWIVSPLRYIWLIPLTMAPQLLMGTFGPGFGPDTSVGLIPQPHLLAYYGIFFLFGACYYNAADYSGQLGRWWWLTLPLALVLLLPLGLLTLGQTWLSGIFQVAYAWLMTCGCIGFSRYCLSRENFLVRYLSDSAYWLYLAHLPLVILLQAWVRDWELPAFVKFTFVCLVTTGSLLASYHFLVRPTWLGWLLNGPRKSTLQRAENTPPILAQTRPVGQS